MTMPGLRSLADNNIRETAGRELAIMLQKNSTLVFLGSVLQINAWTWNFEFNIVCLCDSLSWNKLNVGGLMALGQGLQNNTSLKYLNVIGNGGDPSTGTALLEASLISSSTPVDLDIDFLPPRSRAELLLTEAKNDLIVDDSADIDNDDIGRKASRSTAGSIGSPPSSRPGTAQKSSTPSGPL